MHNVDMRLGRAVADLFKAARVLNPEHLDELLDNVTVEIVAALMEEEARQKAARDATLGQTPKGNVLAFALPSAERASRSSDT